jgi:DNA-binding CsgD family transcriptional regulator
MIYVSENSTSIVGIKPENLNAFNVFTITHPDDIQRHSISRSRLFRLCHDMFKSGKEKAILTTSFHHFCGNEIINSILIQCYVFANNLLKSNLMYCFFVYTDITWFGELKYGFNYYIGDDMSFFRKPDKELILTGATFTRREYEIIKLAKEGFSSVKIGEKLFISPYTVDKHRANIVKKTGKWNISELVIELQEIGFL